LRDDSLPAFLSPEAWDRRAERILDSSDYDTELGKKMARDAIRVTSGELSEAEFHRKYHEDVLEEFGVDNRPTAPEDDE
jgi:molybdopterin-containing oxidoreductase family iron-sulfur binding subunit